MGKNSVTIIEDAGLFKSIQEQWDLESAEARKLREELKDLEEKQKRYEGKARAERIAEIELELEDLQKFPQPFTASELLAEFTYELWRAVDDGEGRVASVLNQLQEAHERGYGIADRFAWKGDELILGEARRDLNRMALTWMWETAPGDWLETLGKIENQAQQRINRADAVNRPWSRSTGVLHNFVEDVQVAANSDFIEGSYTGSNFKWGRARLEHRMNEAIVLDDLRELRAHLAETE